MSEEDLERYETEMELQLYKEYRDVLPLFGYVVETERRFYLANTVDMQLHDDDGANGGRSHLELELKDAWVWDIYRPGPRPLRVVGAHRHVQGREHREDPQRPVSR